MSSFHREVWCQPAVDWYWNISVVQASHRVILKYFCIAVQWNSVQWLARLYFEICVGVTKTCPLLWVRVIKQTFAAPAPPFFDGGWGGKGQKEILHTHSHTHTLMHWHTHIHIHTHKYWCSVWSCLCSYTAPFFVVFWCMAWWVWLRISFASPSLVLKHVCFFQQCKILTVKKKTLWTCSN